MIFEESETLFQQQLHEIFKPVKETEQSTLFQILSLVIYHDNEMSDLYDVYRLLGVEDFIKLAGLFDGRTIRFPTTTKLRDSIILVLCFYYKEVEGLEWKDIRKRVPFEFDSTRVAYRIKRLNKLMFKELKQMLTRDKEDKK